MTLTDWRDLVVLTIKDPATAANQVMAWQVPRNTMWITLILVATCNSILFSLSELMVGGASMLPGAFDVPFIVFAMMAGGLVLTVFSIFWAGRLTGGQGTFDDIMALIVWLQVLRLGAQAAVLVLMLTIPLLSALLTLVVLVVGLYILVHFVNEGHQFKSISKTIGVMLASLLVFVMGVAAFFTLLGVSFLGAAGNV